MSSAALNKPVSNEEFNNYFLSTEVNDLLVENKVDNDFGLISDNQEIYYDKKLYLARKNINKLKNKISTLESEISRYKNNIQELSGIDDFVEIDDEDNERLIEMKEILNKYLDIHKKLKLDLMRKRLELEMT
ncbi:MAG: hypothetical protein CME75_01405 [Halomonas sp.]|nr:hypothetical protein [Halomonas sp.]